VMSLDFSVTYSFGPSRGPGVDSAPSENEYQEHFLGLKVAGAWGWQPHHLHVLNVMKSGSLNLLEPSGTHQACYGTPLPFTALSSFFNCKTWSVTKHHLRQCFNFFSSQHDKQNFTTCLLESIADC